MRRLKRLFAVFSLCVIPLAISACSVSRVQTLEERGESSSVVRAAVDDALNPTTLPEFCQEAKLNYNRTVAGSEVNRNDGDVVVRHTGRASCMPRTMKRNGGWQIGEWE